MQSAGNGTCVSGTTDLWERKVFDELVRRHGPLLSTEVPGFGKVVLVLDPPSVRDIVTCPPGSLISGRGNAILGFLYGSSSMFLVDGPPHHRLRRLLVPPFRNRDTLASYGRIIETVAQELLDHMPRDKPFALLPVLRHSMLEITLRVVFGLSDESRLAPFREAMTSCWRSPHPLPPVCVVPCAEPWASDGPACNRPCRGVMP